MAPKHISRTKIKILINQEKFPLTSHIVKNNYYSTKIT